MNKFSPKDYQPPSCQYCYCDLFLEEVYHRGHLYRVDPDNGLPDQSAQLCRGGKGGFYTPSMFKMSPLL